MILYAFIYLFWKWTDVSFGKPAGVKQLKEIYDKISGKCFFRLSFCLSLSMVYLVVFLMGMDHEYKRLNFPEGFHLSILGGDEK